MYLEDDAENVPKLSEVVVKKNKDLIVDNLTLTVKKDEIFVLIEDNGWGKSAILQNIAGLTDVDSGMATAFVIYLLNSLRFITDNLLSLSLQNAALIENMTTAEHITYFANSWASKTSNLKSNKSWQSSTSIVALN